MERITGNMKLPEQLRGGIAALGNFDGFHLGHRAVVGRAKELATVAGVPALVVTFDPHPLRLFRPATPPFMLSTTAQKLDLLEAFGVDASVVLAFDADFADITAEAFVSDWLAEKCGLSGIVTGDNFTFGRHAAGNTPQLKDYGAAHGMETHVVSPVRDEGGAIISSTRVRAALQAGDCELAGGLLGHPFSIRGIVEHGDKRGRTIGVPTANVTLGDYVRPAYGVYAVRCRLANGEVVDGVANIGVRPMFDPPKELLEIWLFDFEGDLYGQEISTSLVKYLRPELKLSGLDELKAQIGKDAEAARAALAA